MPRARNRVVPTPANTQHCPYLQVVVVVVAVVVGREGERERKIQTALYSPTHSTDVMKRNTSPTKKEKSCYHKEQFCPLYLLHQRVGASKR